MSEINEPMAAVAQHVTHRLINSKFPPIAIFEDVADADDFEILYELQTLTNPRLTAEAGDVSKLNPEHMPFGIKGCSYAVAPFTHINKEGSRFSDGEYGVLYLADTLETAIAETTYHQGNLWKGVKGLKYDTIIMRALKCTFSSNSLADICESTSEGMATNPLYDANDYAEARRYGRQARKAGVEGLRYTSVRNPFVDCYALFTPVGVEEIIQSAHYAYVWDGEQIAVVRKISKA